MILVKSIKYFTNIIKSVTLNTTVLNNLTITFLHRLSRGAVPLATKRFGLGLLVLLLPIIWKIWPDATTHYSQLGVTPDVEPSVEVAETSTPDVGIDPTPDVGTSEQPAPVDAPVAPEQGQGWSRAVKWGLLIVGAGAILIGVVTVWYYWPTAPNMAPDPLGVTATINQNATVQAINGMTNAFSNEMRPVNELHTVSTLRIPASLFYYDLPHQLCQTVRPWIFTTKSITYSDLWVYRAAEERVWNLIGDYTRSPITKKTIAQILEHAGYRSEFESAIDFVNRMNNRCPLQAIYEPVVNSRTTLDAISKGIGIGFVVITISLLIKYLTQ